MSVEIVTSTAPPRPRRRASHALAGAGLLLVLAGLWVRGVPRFVAWEVARDHQRCSGRRHLPARVWSADPAEVHEWLEARGTPTPPLPAYAHASELVGARYCPLLDRVAAHVYYGGEGAGIVSVFVLSGPARIGDGWAGTVGGLHVRLLRAAARTLAVVGESEGDVVATARAFLVTVAAADRPTPAARPSTSPRLRPRAAARRPTRRLRCVKDRGTRRPRPQPDTRSGNGRRGPSGVGPASAAT